jgi:hypothetical protein
MEVSDLQGCASIQDEADLNQRLESVRNGDYGAFVLWHNRGGASLWIHINKDIAYLHYFPDDQGKHPGYQPTGMSPTGCADEMRFVLVGGHDADDIVMPRETLVPVGMAYMAAREFLHKPSRPASISWVEL